MGSTINVTRCQGGTSGVFGVAISRDDRNVYASVIDDAGLAGLAVFARDGKNVYVASNSSNAVAVFARARR